MKVLVECPKVLFHKVVYTLVIGIAIMMVGLAYFMFSNDTITLYLSIAIVGFSGFRAYSLCRTIAKGRYEVVEGTCVAVSQKPFRKHFNAKLMDDAGIESTVRLTKQSRVKIGRKYRFYFSQAERIPLGSEYLNTALSQGNFLGFEDLGDIMDVSNAKQPTEGGADDAEDTSTGANFVE